MIQSRIPKHVIVFLQSQTEEKREGLARLAIELINRGQENDQIMMAVEGGEIVAALPAWLAAVAVLGVSAVIAKSALNPIAATVEDGSERLVH